MKKLFFLSLLSFLIIDRSYAQFSRYIVRLKNKGATTFTLANPSAYLSQRAVDRRTRFNISIDSTDIPVPSAYITQIKNVPNVTLLNVSKWLNAVTILTTDANAINSINALPFVQSTAGIAARINSNGRNKYDDETEPLTSRIKGTTGDFFSYGTASFNEIHLHKGEFLHNIGLRGQGMQIAMLDAGYFNYTSLKAFDSARLNGQILSTWDFVNRESSVVEDYLHGMQCFSTIAANIPGQFIGKAPKASFHLFRTEDVNSEYPIEEFNWVCGAERADSTGSDVISSSLGYNTFDNPTFDHTYSQMNGNTIMCTIGADLAAKKGIIVFNAAGNEGSGSWHYIIAPADGDSVVAVGAVSSTGTVGAFSSFGPSADGRIKPEVASVGVNALVQATNNTIGVSNGTSFATPNMAGLGTCLWQGFPEFNNMRIIRALKEAGNTFTSPNDRTGYGIPDMKLAFASLLTEYATSTATISNCTTTLNWNSKDVSAMKYEIERKIPGDVAFTKIADVNPQASDVLANHSYQFTNALTNVTVGTISYRIRQVIDTAAASFMAIYIDTANVSLAADCLTTNVFKVQPSPTTSNATLIVQTSTAIPNMAIAMYDMKGRLMMKMKTSKGPGKVTIDLPVTSVLASGKYIVHIYDNQKLIGTTDLLKL